MSGERSSVVLVVQHKDHQAIDNVCSQPSGQITCYAFSPLKEQLHGLTFQLPQSVGTRTSTLRLSLRLWLNIID